MTIAITVALSSPTIVYDLMQFDQNFGLPAPPSFTIVNQNGGTNLPPGSGTWAREIALDVEWAHAIAPKAAILLVEGDHASLTSLNMAAAYAAKQPGVSVVSMSFLGGEYSGQFIDDLVFQTPSGHAGVTFIAASGDSDGSRRMTSVCIFVSKSASPSNSSNARRASASFEGRRAWTN